MAEQKFVKIICSDAAGLLYVPCCKCASTTIIDWLGSVSLSLSTSGSALEVKSGRRSQWFRSAILSEERILVADLHRYLRAKSGYTLFCASRNPYHRIVSAYADKLNRYCKNFDRKRYYAGKIFQIFSGPSAWFSNKAANRFLCSQLSLREFLFGLKLNGLDFDPHFMPQVEVLLPDEIKYDSILKVEDLSAGLSSLLNQRGLSNSFSSLPVPGNLNCTNTSSHGDSSNVVRKRLSESLDGKMAAVVRELYAMDFEQLDYDVGSQDLA